LLNVITTVSTNDQTYALTATKLEPFTRSVSSLTLASDKNINIFVVEYDCCMLLATVYNEIISVRDFKLRLTRHQAMKTYQGSEGIVPRILDLVTRWR